MSESKHTPGPWKVSGQNGDGLPEFEGLVGVTGPAQSNSRGRAFTLYVAQYIKPDDAELIASAPELADALRELHDAAEVDTHFRYAGRLAAAFLKAAELLRRIGK